MQNNISSQELAGLWNQFCRWEIPVHSLLVSQHGKLVFECYREPYGADKLHRMFSITKSFCSLAAGSLAAEGRLSLDQPVVDFFPEYFSCGRAVHPYMAEMTLRHMLTMQTCHSFTTYKLHPERNWVESFFITAPTHRSGQIFLYDTSSSHALAALVKKQTGMGVLNYLRTRFLDGLGFSKDSYIIRDPFGDEMGGSGLMARPMDLLVTAEYLLYQLLNGTDSFSEYLRGATRFQVPTVHFGQTLDEQQGYGYQFWIIRGGFAMYGMGGQYVLFYPQYRLVFVITADAQNIKGGTQKILDAVHDLLMPRERGIKTPGCRPGAVKGKKAYALNPNQGGFTALSMEFHPDGGLLGLSHPAAEYEIPFASSGPPTLSVIERYHQPIASLGTWLDDSTLLISSQLCGEAMGSLTFLLRFRPDGITLWMKKVEESFFQEFCGFAEGALCRIP